MGIQGAEQLSRHTRIQRFGPAIQSVPFTISAEKTTMSEFQVLVPHHKRPSWFWWVIFIGMPLASAFGTVGFWLYENRPAGVAPWINAFYHSLQLFILHMPHLDGPINWCLEIGRWLAAGLFGMAALIALYDIIGMELRHSRLRFAENHTVICGVGPRVLELAGCFKNRDRNRPVVVVSPDEEELVACRAAGAITIVGDPVVRANLARARIQTARRIIALSSDDNTNVQVAVEAKKLIHENTAGSSEPVECFVHLADVGLRASLHRTSPFEDQRYRMRFFDLFDAAARQLLLEPLHLSTASSYRPLDQGGISKDEPREVHLVILGFGRMGRTVAVRAAQLGHFANGKSIHISVIDRDAARHEQMLLFRYPKFKQTCSIEFHETEIETTRARDLLGKWCAATDAITSIALCFDQDSLALEVALRLFPVLRQFNIPLAVRMSRRSGFASLLEEGKADPDVRFQLRGFGMLEDACCEDVLGQSLNETLARAIHSIFRDKRMKEGRDPSDRSVRPWEELDDDFKDSSRQQADHIAIKLHGIGCVRAKSDDARPTVGRFDPVEIETMARMEHSRWNAERLLAGWVLGPKGSSTTASPYIVPWDELPPEIQNYDRDAVILIPALLAGINEKVCRKDSSA